MISLEKDFNRCIEKVDAFLPFIDNWATCDQLSPGVFKTAPEKLLPSIHTWIQSDQTYTVRFAIGMLILIPLLSCTSTHPSAPARFVQEELCPITPRSIASRATAPAV